IGHDEAFADRISSTLVSSGFDPIGVAILADDGDVPAARLLLPTHFNAIDRTGTGDRVPDAVELWPDIVCVTSSAGHQHRDDGQRTARAARDHLMRCLHASTVGLHLTTSLRC